MTPHTTMTDNPLKGVPAMVHAELDDGGADPLRIAMEHRWGQRVPCRLDIWIDAGPGVGGTAHLRDVSMSGAFLETSLELPLLAHIDVAVVRDGAAGRDTAIPASVVRKARDGVGVEWCETSRGSICTLLGCTSRCAASVKPLCQRSK